MINITQGQFIRTYVDDEHMMKEKVLKTENPAEHKRFKKKVQGFIYKLLDKLVKE